MIDSSPLDSKITKAKDVRDPTTVFFMASLRLFLKFTKAAKWIHICGGCLISLQHVLSAAQCVILIRKHFNREVKNAAAFFGSLYIDGFSNSYLIKDTMGHNIYNESCVYYTSGYDIGVILVCLLTSF